MEWAGIPASVENEKNAAVWSQHGDRKVVGNPESLVVSITELWSKLVISHRLGLVPIF